MLDNLPDIHAPESDADDIYTPERLDNSADIYAPESDADDMCTLERLDNLPDDVWCNEERSSTCNDQESILKKAKLIRNFGITSFSFMGIIILLFIIDIIAEPSHPNSSPFSDISAMNIATFVVGAALQLANLVFMILAIDKFGKTDWGNEDLNNQRVYSATTLWCFIIDFIAFKLMIALTFVFFDSLLIIGLLFLLPLGIIPPIMWIVWGNKVKNTYSTNT